MPRQILVDGVIHSFPDDATDAEVSAALNGPSAGSTSAAPAHASSFMDSAVDALPTIGGVVGSFAGAGKWNPVGVAGAGLGGMIGESAKQVANAVRGRLDLVPSSVGAQLKDIGAAGAVQSGGELVGQGAAKVLEPMAKGLYGLALRPIKSLRDKYGLGNLIREGFENRIMPTAGGATKAGALVSESKTAQRGMATAYDAAGGAPLRVMDAAKTGLGPVIAKANAGAAATGAESGTPTVIRQIRRVQKTQGPRVSAEQMMGLKTAADDIADPAFAAARRTGESVPDISEAGIAKGWSKGYRQTLNDAVGPDFAKQGLKTKALYGVKRAASYSAERPEMASTIMSGVAGEASSGGDQGKALKNALLYRALLSPRVQAGAALAIQPVAHYAPRAIDAITGSNAEQSLRQALLARLSSEQPQAGQ